ncbi:MAG: hypothetical protein K6F15_09700 [Treponema sp.]|nr:hypothetical protein [Treponema sp.]
MNDIEGYADGEEPLHFYYNREERIKNAPKIVQDYYSGKFDNSSRGLFKTLFATRGNRFMFAGILIFMIFIWVYSFIIDSAFSSVCGSKVDFKSFAYEETIYSSLKFNSLDEKALKQNKDSLPVKLRVTLSAVDSAGGISDEVQEIVIFSGEELFVRTKFSDYDIVKVDAVIYDGIEEKKFVSFVERH